MSNETFWCSGAGIKSAHEAKGQPAKRLAVAPGQYNGGARYERRQARTRYEFICVAAHEGVNQKYAADLAERTRRQMEVGMRSVAEGWSPERLLAELAEIA
jgi:hypothetical protein